MEHFDLFFSALAVVVFIIVMAVARRVRELEKSVFQLRAQVRQLYKQSGAEFEPAVDKKLYDLLSSGQTIKAIKLYREMTGKGLKQSKDAIEAMQRGEPAPDL
jgi:ribosomal protein L7/L12